MSYLTLRNPKLGYCAALLILAAFKLWLASAIAILASTWAGHDDRLFINLAASLIQHHWLGDYNQYLLIKGPGFSFWLTLLHWLNVPLILGNSALSIIAATIFSWAINRLTGSYLLALFCYAVLVFNMDINHRVVRESFYAPLTLLLFSLITLQLVYYGVKKELSLAGVFIFSALLAWYWVIREEGMWIIPALLMNIFLLAYLIYRQKKTILTMYRPFLLLSLPFIVLYMGNTIIANINSTLYQSKNVVEMKSDEFISAYGSLSRVNPDSRQRFIPVTKTSRAAIYNVSPAYREISPYLDAESSSWRTTCNDYSPSTSCGEIAGGSFMWALRDAVAKAGYYKTGAAATTYYWQLTQEINNACEQKLLTCSAERHTLLPIIDRDDIGYIFTAFITGINEIICPTIYQPESMRAYWVLFGSSGDNSAIDYFSTIIHDPIAPLEHSNEHARYSKNMQKNKQIKILLILEDLYQLCFTPLLLACTLCFIYKIKLMFSNKSLDILWLLNASLLLAITIRIIILAIIDAMSFPAINPLYISPAYPLTLMFILINIVNFFKPYYLTALTNDECN